MIKMLFLVIMSIITISSYAQNEPQPKSTSKSKSSQSFVVTKSQKKSVTISKKAGEEQVVHNDAYYLDQISKIDQHINSINVKIAHIKSDEAENTKALNSGWFDSMNNTLVRLNEKKASFQTKLNK